MLHCSAAKTELHGPSSDVSGVDAARPATSQQADKEEKLKTTSKPKVGGCFV